MPRETAEWIADNPDAAIPDRVKVRVFERHNGRCAKCTRRLQPGRFAFDHIVALINGGKHAESNLQPLCNSPCHSGKTKRDVAEKSKVYRIRKRHLGLRKMSRFGCARSSPYKRKLTGEIVRREPS